MLKHSWFVLMALLVSFSVMAQDEEDGTIVAFYNEVGVETHQIASSNTGNLVLSEDFIGLQWEDESFGPNFLEVEDLDLHEVCIITDEGIKIQCVNVYEDNACITGWDGTVCLEPTPLIPYYTLYQPEEPVDFEWSTNIFQNLWEGEVGISIQGKYGNATVIEGNMYGVDSLDQYNSFMNTSAYWLLTQDRIETIEARVIEVPFDPFIESQMMMGYINLPAPVGFIAVDDPGINQATCQTPSDGLCNYDISDNILTVAVGPNGGAIVVENPSFGVPEVTPEATQEQ